MATALARRTSGSAKKSGSSKGGRGAIVRARAAQVVRVVRAGGSRAAAAARRVSGSEETKRLALGVAGAAATGAVAAKIPIPPSVTQHVPKSAIIGAVGVLGSMALKGKTRTLVQSVAAGPLFAGAYELGQKAGQSILSGDEEVGYADEVPGNEVAGEFDDLH